MNVYEFLQAKREMGERGSGKRAGLDYYGVTVDTLMSCEDLGLGVEIREVGYKRGSDEYVCRRREVGEIYRNSESRIAGCIT